MDVYDDYEVEEKILQLDDKNIYKVENILERNEKLKVKINQITLINISKNSLIKINEMSGYDYFDNINFIVNETDLDKVNEIDMKEVKIVNSTDIENEKTSKILNRFQKYEKYFPFVLFVTAILLIINFSIYFFSKNVRIKL